jgi:short-subunit dehydrogenase
MVAVITGSSKGIGRALAIKYAKGGYHLALCARGMEDLIRLEDEISQVAPLCDVMIRSVDVSSEDEVKRFGQEILATYPTIDILINNAGIYLPGDVLTEDIGTLQSLIQTNLYSAYHLTRTLAPSMIDAGKGHIINMCSVASLLALPGGGSYSISKFALLGFSKVLREELKPKGVKVTSVMPGATWSDSWKGVDLPYERLMEANDIADTIWSATHLGPSAVIEDIVIRPQLGDL